jgi:cell division protein FtsB
VRARLSREVELLAAEPPSRDMVEEIAREMLGLLYPGEQKIR